MKHINTLLKNLETELSLNRMFHPDLSFLNYWPASFSRLRLS